MPKIVNKIKKIKRKIEKKVYSQKDTFTPVQVKRESTKPMIWLLGTEDYGNLGDHMIAVAQLHFLNDFFPEYNIMEISSRNYFEQREKLIENVLPQDIIVGTGGGNIGNYYLLSEQIRNDFIQLFPNNRIVIMPQTIWYTKDNEGKKELEKAIRIFSSHKKLLLVAREQFSYEFAKKYFHNEVILIPDIVLYEKPFREMELSAGKITNKVKGKVVVCIRSDMESAISVEKNKQIMTLLRKKFKQIKKIDTQKKYLISTENREKELRKMFTEIASAELVITDRLHGMVFSALAETPAIVFDNCNNKVKGIYQWINKLPYIIYIGKNEMITESILDTIRNEETIYIDMGLKERFAALAEKIKG